MKYFAITPDDIRPELISASLPRLRRQAVTHLYLRSQSLRGSFKTLAPVIRMHEIMPIIPQELYRDDYGSGCGAHTRSTDRFRPLGIAGFLQTASCHSAEQACALLDSGAAYVFISPVGRPISKPGDVRPLIPADDLLMLTSRYGERIVLLGGLTTERINEIRAILNADFSVAGISMFFAKGITDGSITPADIPQ